MPKANLRFNLTRLEIRTSHARSKVMTGVLSYTAFSAMRGIAYLCFSKKGGIVY